MADLGTLDTPVSLTTNAIATAYYYPIATTKVSRTERGAIVPIWGYSADVGNLTATLAIPTNGRIYGTVLEDSAPVLWNMVRCYYRANGNLVARAFTAADGSYEFIGLNPSDKYTIVAGDTTNTYNARVQDNVTPDLIT